MKPLIAVLWGLVALFNWSTVDAAPTVRDHMQYASKSDYQASMNIWLDGAIGAFLAGNADLTQTRKNPPLFCLPKGQSINSAGALKLIDQAIGTRRWKEWVPLSTVLLDALQHTYPCK